VPDGPIDKPETFVAHKPRPTRTRPNFGKADTGLLPPKQRAAAVPDEQLRAELTRSYEHADILRKNIADLKERFRKARFRVRQLESRIMLGEQLPQSVRQFAVGKYPMRPGSVAWNTLMVLASDPATGWKAREIAEALAQNGQPVLSKRPVAAVRTALWNFRQRGIAEVRPDGLTYVVPSALDSNTDDLDADDLDTDDTSDTDDA
jgi:hypothetical protein